jgi:hypothetical protein
MKLSSKILEFNARFQFKRLFILENFERYGITVLEIELLNKLWKEWCKKYLKYINPSSHRKSSIDDIAECFERCYAIISSINIKVKNCYLLKLTSLEKIIFQINRNTKELGKVPVTGYAPCLALLEESENLLKFYAINPKGLNSKKKPAGADKIGIMAAYTLPNELEPDNKDFKKLNAAKKSIFDVIITPDKAGMWLYIKVYYISPTGEEGKASKPMLVKLMGVPSN